MAKKKIVIIGAGPGGLTAGMILAHRGFDVHIYEKASVVGGRNAAIKLGDYTFDTGPTFLMMKFILDEMFEETGRKSSDYLDIKQIEPMYRLIFDKMEFSHRSNMADMVKEMDAKFPGESKNLSWFMKEEGERFEKMFPCLQKDYSSFKDMFWPTFLKAIPFLALDRSLYNNLARYHGKRKYTDKKI